MDSEDADPTADPIAHTAVRERQRLRLPEAKLRSLREWAVDGTGVSAVARVLDPEGRIALVRNAWTDGWFLPGGGVEPGETPREAARREIREELGLVATVGDPLVAVDQTFVADSDGSEWFSAVQVVYDARAEGPIPDASQLGITEEEILAARWFETLPEEVHDDELFGPYLRRDPDDS